MSNQIETFQEQLKTISVASYFNNDKEKMSKFKRTVLDYYSQNSELKKLANIASIIEACKKIAQMGLTLGGDVHIIVRGGVAKAELDYKGYHTMLSKANIQAKANVVYENDVFDLDLAEGSITHKPNLRGSRGSILGYYAMIKVSGSWVIDYMSQEELQNWKKVYLPYVSPAWKSSESEMAKKTILKRTVKPYLYSTNNEELIRATDEDNNAETNNGESLNFVDVNSSVKKSDLQIFIEEEAQTIEALLKATANRQLNKEESEAYAKRFNELEELESTPKEAPKAESPKVKAEPVLAEDGGLAIEGTKPTAKI